jgi:hypothetical protein
MWRQWTAGQKLLPTSADHISATSSWKLIVYRVGISLAARQVTLALLEPIVSGQQLTASIPGNFWLEVARAALVGAMDRRIPPKSPGKRYFDAICNKERTPSPLGQGTDAAENHSGQRPDTVILQGSHH